MTSRLRNSVTALMMVLVMGVVLSCGRDEPIRIGFVAGLSGRVADLGVAGRNGVMLAMDQANARGGIDGRPIELIVKDDRQDPDTAQKVIRELVDQEPDLIIGPMTSSMAMVMVPVVNESKIVMISPTATTRQLEKKDDQFLRVISTTREYASKIAAFQYERHSRRRAAAIYDVGNRSYTEIWLNDFRDTFESLGGQIVETVSFVSGTDTAFFDSVKGLLDTQPDLFIVVANAVDAALICQQVRKLDHAVPIALSEWASTERFVELGGAAAEGAYVAQFLNREDRSDRYQSFRRAYLDRFGHEPGFAGIAGFDAALVALDALSGQKKGDTLKAAILRKERYQCVQQEIVIDRFGDANRSTFLTRVENGKYVNVE